MGPRWEDVLDVQLHIHQFMTSDAGHRFGMAWFDRNAHDPRLAGLADHMESAGAAWAERTGIDTFNSEPIYVDADMMTVIEAAVAGFHSEPLLETDLITRQGLLVLPRPLWLRPDTDDGDEKYALSWSAAQWTVRGNWLTLALFHDTHEPDDLDLAQPAAAAISKRLTRYAPTHAVTWPIGQMHPGTGLRLGHEDVQTQLQAIWRLMNQTMAVRTKARPPRGFLRRAQKAQLPGEHVTIVRLRRPSQESEPGDPTIVHWSHRWVVGGHWRNQWYSSLNIHRQIWISPYVKGPEELPLIVNKARIFALVR